MLRSSDPFTPAASRPPAAGKLYTVFSAPLYPQFGTQHQNLGAVVVLSSPGFAEPRFVQFSAVPRPEVRLGAVQQPQCMHS